MKRSFIFSSLFVLAMCIALAVQSLAASVPEDADAIDVEVIWDGEVMESEDAVYMMDGRTFIPIRWIEHRTDAAIEWNLEEMQLRVHAPAGDIVTFYIGTNKLYWQGKHYFMDVESFIANGRIYVPTRYIAGIVSLDIEWNDENKQQLLIASSEENELKILASEEPPAQETAATYSEEDLMLLAKIIDAEAGSEPFEGQIAVGSVILNRVDSAVFPDTIRDVIYQPNQFGPARTGKLDQIEPREDALRAAEMVLKGEERLEGALYFYNPKRDSQTFFKRLTKVKDIGNHRFMK